MEVLSKCDMGDVLMCAIPEIPFVQGWQAWFLALYGPCVAHWTNQYFQCLVLVYLSGVIYKMHFVQHHYYFFFVQISCFAIFVAISVCVCSFLTLSDLQSSRQWHQ